MSDTPLAIASVRARIYRCPADPPVVTSFGVMRDRPMVLVRVEDRDGAVGWGEIWCNYPPNGAEHRAGLVNGVFAALVEGRIFAGAPDAFAALTAATAIMALQAGEPGPFAQCIAGIDTALWDLTARRAGQPLWRLLGGAAPTIPVYASGLNPDAPERLAAARQAEGFRAFKLKIGFGTERDLANLAALRKTLGEAAVLMADANQAWTPAQARAIAPALGGLGLRWLEEPILASHPWEVWRALKDELTVPLAAGENISGHDGFDAALTSGVLAFVQPDVGKWGGISGVLAVGRKIRDAGRIYCPHWLGGGVGLLASAHLLAAIGGDGSLEIDANPNPLRALTCGPLTAITDGHATLSDEPGIGEVPDETALQRYLVGS